MRRRYELSTLKWERIQPLLPDRTHKGGPGRPWLPHLTVARWRVPPQLRPELPSVGTFVPSDAAAYLSRLHPGGARYEVLESVALGG